MRPQSAEPLRIELTSAKGHYVTIWHLKAGGAPRVIPTQISLNRIGDFRRSLGRDMQIVKNCIGTSLSLRSWKKISKAVSLLRDIGDRATFALFGTNRIFVDQVIRENCVGWDHEDFPIPVLTITGQTESFIPFEILPSLYMPQDADVNAIENSASLHAAMKRFLGYSCIVQRVIEAGDLEHPAYRKLHSDPRLRMKLFVERALKGARREETLFNLLKGRLELDIWPKKGVKSHVPQLANYLWETYVTTSQVRMDAPDQIHHFASHCHVRSQHPEDHSIRLGACKRSKLSARLGDLGTEFGKLSKFELPAILLRPLVFVNACSSSKVDPDRIWSFPDLFLNKLRSRGYLGAETMISDSVAAEFSYQFYRRLFEGCRLGEALHDARKSLILKHNNPLGLFYTCYASPEMHISHPLTSNFSIDENQTAQTT